MEIISFFALFMVILALIEERVRSLYSAASTTELVITYDDIQLCGQHVL